MLSSDDFDGGVLGDAWTFSGPAGTSVGLGVDGAERFAVLSVPAGDFNVWGGQRGARLLQAAADEDLEIAARFLSTPTAAFQVQGLVVEEDADTWIRFDTYHDGTRLRAFAAVTLDGASSVRFNVALPVAAAPYLKVVRTGDTWSFAWSADGETFVTAGSFTQAIAVTAVGPFAGSTGAAPGFVAKVDWFETADDPILAEDGESAPDLAPVAVDDALATAVDTPLTIDVAADLLANDADPEGGPLSLASVSAPATGTLADNGDGTLTYTPAAGFSGTDTFTYAVTDGASTVEATVTVAVEAPPEPPAPLSSDDFAGESIDGRWNFSGPAGTGTRLEVEGAERFLVLDVPAGDFNVWGAKRGARVLQATADGDLEIAARFLSTPTAAFQMQGLLVEEDADTWIRFDTYHDGTRLRAFAAVTLDGASSVRFNKALPVAAAPYLKVVRDGDVWTMSWSTDGTVWTTAGSFSQAITVTAVGPFAGSTGAAPGFEAKVDWFETATDPLASEDGIAGENLPPVAVDDAFATGIDTPIVIAAADLLGNDTDPEGRPLSIVSIGAPGTGALADNGDGSYTYTPAPGFSGSDTFTYVVGDGSFTDEGTVTVSVEAEPEPPGPFASDDFGGDAIASRWDFAGPAGTAARLEAAGAERYLVLDVPDGDYNVWGPQRGARLMQATDDGDLEISARFLSTPSAAFQMQGLLVEEDADTWIRFDTYHDGGVLRVFAAVTLDGASTVRFNKVLPVAAAPYLKVVRDGDTWTMSWSTDGTVWTTAGSFTQAITVTAVGPFAGSTGAAPGFEAKVDWFETATDPLAVEDPPNAPPEPVEDLLSTDLDAPLVFTAADLLGNDVDPDGDALVLVDVGTPDNGTLVDNGDGTFTYVPAAGFVGTDSFAYTVGDGEALAVGTVRIAVKDPESAPPSAGADAAVVPEDGSVLVDVLANDTDPDGGPLSIVWVGRPSHGTATIDDGGTPLDPSDDRIRYVPDADFFGTDSFAYRIDDGRGHGATAIVTVTVAPVNDLPVARPDTFATGRDAPLVIAASALLANDFDVEQGPLSVGAFSQPSHGTLVDNGDGTLTYVPDAGFVGTDTFGYAASDGAGQSAPAKVTIDVGYPAGIGSDDFSSSDVNGRWRLEGPAGTARIVADASDSYLELAVPDGNFDMWGSDRSVARLMQDADDADFSLEARFLDEPDEATEIQGLLVEQDGSNWLRFDAHHDGTHLRLFGARTIGGSSTPLFNIKVPASAAEYLRIDRSGDTFTFRYSGDGTTWATAGTATVALAVSAVGPFAGSVGAADGHVAKIDYVFNRAAPIDPEDDSPASPTPADDIVAASAGGPTTIAIASLLANDSDPNGDLVFATGFGTPAHGSLVDAGDGTLTYVAAAGFTGVDRFTYTVSDGTGTPPATATVFVAVDNVVPIAGDDAATVAEDGSVAIDLLANDDDPDGDALAIAEVIQPAHGTVTIGAGGVVLYVPDPDFNGTDTFAYAVTDGVETATAVATVTVTPVPDAPRPARDSFALEPDTPVVIAATELLANDVDPDGDTLSITGVGDPAHGTLVDQGDGTFLYTPNAGFAGADSFVYTVSDGTGRSASATVDLVVGTVIDVWYGDHQVFGTPGETQRWINVLGNVDPGRVTALTYSLNGGPERPLSIGPDTRRLQEPADFNVDIAYDELDGGPGHDVVTIRATLPNGAVATRNVVIDYLDGNRWSPDYAIDWSDVAAIQDVAQIVDGKWTLSDAGIRLEEPGYDRFVTIGDKHWDNYELRIGVTMHDLETVDPRGRDGGVFGFGMIWGGHTDDPVPNFQPKSGWNPSELIFFRNTANGGEFNFFGRTGSTPFSLEEGETYEFRLRVEQDGPFGHTYLMKVCEAGTPEPGAWLINRTIQYGEPMTGSLMLLSHYYDVTFRDLVVEEIPGHDIVVAEAAGGPLIAVDPQAAAPGRGEIDVLKGGEGDDIFVLGENGIAFYDDGIAQSSGTDDYALVWGFEPGRDAILLGGSASDYLLADATGGLPSGTAIWRADGATDELIGIVAGVDGLSLVGGDFLFDNPIA